MYNTHFSDVMLIKCLLSNCVPLVFFLYSISHSFSAVHHVRDRASLILSEDTVKGLFVYVTDRERDCMYDM